MKKRFIGLMTLATLTAAGLLAGCGGSTSAGDQNASLQSKQLQRSTKLTVGSYEDVVQSLYIAYFGRPADPVGLSNFESALLDAGAPTDIPTLSDAYASSPAIQALIDNFSSSKESQSLYGNGNANAFVTAVFENVLGRAPQAAGLAYWSDAITSGTLSQSDAALSIMAGALSNNTSQGVLDGELIDNRLTAASYFTSQVTSQNGVNAYSGASAAAAARTMLGAVTATTNLSTFEANIAGLVTTLINSSITVAGNLSPYTAGAGYLTINNNANGAVILDTLGNRYALDASTDSVVSVDSQTVLTGLTANSAGYLIFNGNIVGSLGLQATASGTDVAVFNFTADTLFGQAEIDLSAESYHVSCANCTSNSGGTSLPTALQTADAQVGTGATATIGSTVTVNYTGWLYDTNAANFAGTEFDSSASHGQPFSFTLGAGNVIMGWDQGIVGMKVGGTRTLIIPSTMAYGATANGSIPANSALIFSVQLLSVQ